MSSLASCREVKKLGIDEIALRKGHRNYVCVLVDLERKEVVDILPQREKAYLKDYFLKLGSEFCDGIELFCADMWEGYTNLAKEIFPNASIVVDRFHFFAMVQKGLETCRKHFQRRYGGHPALKGIRWALLKNSDNLSEKDSKAIAELRKHKELKLLADTYDAKIAFRDILEEKLDPKEAEKRIDQWANSITDSKIRHMFRFLKTLDKWKKYILAYFEERATTSPVEGINNKIKAIKRRAFGYLNFSNFRRKVLIEFLKP